MKWLKLTKIVNRERRAKWKMVNMVIWQKMEIPLYVTQLDTASKYSLDYSHRAGVVSYGGKAAARKFVIEYRS